jgi:hypothetical protein
MVATGQMKLMVARCEAASRGSASDQADSAGPHQAHTIHTAPQTFIGKPIASLYSCVELSDRPVNSKFYD